MSRSRKKYSHHSDYSRNGTPYSKVLSRRAVRRYKGHIPNGCAFKKLYCSWNIYDYKHLNHKAEIGLIYDIRGYVWLTQEEYDKGKRK